MWGAIDVVAGQQLSVNNFYFYTQMREAMLALYNS